MQILSACVAHGVSGIGSRSYRLHQRQSGGSFRFRSGGREAYALRLKQPA